MTRYTRRRFWRPSAVVAGIEMCHVEFCEQPVSNVGMYSRARLLCANHKSRATRYGLSDERLIEILSKTECDSCGIEFGTLIKNIDHDHNLHKGQPNYVRGLLCTNCNTRLGRHKDSIYTMKDNDPLIEYLMKERFA